jgi:ligand-binding sensor domain-containing protein/anti-sigma regulatory factor (Ser/Thr protein kinase)
MYFTSVNGIISLLLILCAAAVRGQEPVFYNYRSNNGLPSNEVYNVRADSKGFLWFATDRGVARFDGSHFVTYSVNDGIEGNVVNDIFMAPNGDVWIAADAKRLYRFTGSRFEAYRYNHLIEKACGNGATTWFGQVRFENNYPAWFSTRAGRLLYIGEDGSMRQDSSSFSISTLICNDEKQLALYSQVKKSKTDQKKPGTEFYFKGKKYTALFSSACIYQKRKNGNVLVSFGDNLFELQNNQVINHCTFPDFITSVYEDNKQQLWIATAGAGARGYPPGAFPDKANEKMYFSSNLIGSVTEDREGGYWFCSYDKGVFYVPDLSIVTLKSNLIETDEFFQEILAADNNRLYAATSRSRIFEISGKATMQFVFSGPQQNNISNCNDLVYDNTVKILYGCFSQGLYTFNMVTRSRADYKISSRSVLPVKNDFYILSPSNLYHHTGRNFITYNKGSFFSIFLLSAQNWLIGFENGLLLFRDGIFMPFKADTVNKRVTCIKQLANGWIVSATLGKGLILIKAGRILRVSLGQANAANMVNDIAVDSNTVWAATEAGIVKADLRNPQQPVVTAIAADNRFPYNNTRKIAYQNGHLYVLAQNNIIIVPENYTVNKEPPPVWLQQVIVGDSIKVNPAEQKVFSFTDNRFRFVFDGVCFKCGSSIRYQYRLSGLHSEWYFTGQSYVEYPSLPPGNYTFEVLAINENNIPSAKPASYSFTIPSPFWKKNWFRVIAVLFAALLTGWLIYLRLKKIQARNRQKELLLTKEQIALSAQINPHFIFNSLNSIQHLIIKEDRQSAALHMANFSRLMRLSLDNSRKKWVLVKDETELLKLYLELESMRFKDKFVYNILVDESITDSSMRIPAMLVQPYVENAVHHGINNLNGKKGIVNVSLQSENGLLVVSVEDNGIGRQKAFSLQGAGKDHLSAGMQITEERLRLLCRETGTPWLFEIIDKQDESGEALGTLVRFNMPCLHTVT